VQDEHMSMEHWSNGTHRRNLQNLPQCHLVHINPTGLGMNPSIHAKRLTTNCLSHSMAQQNDRTQGRKILCVGIIQFYALCDLMMEHIEQTMLSPLTYVKIKMMQVEKYIYITPIVNSEVHYQQQLIIMPAGSRNFQVPNVPSSTATQK